jgi:hypothetical protein
MNDASRGFAEYWDRYVRYHSDDRVGRLQFAATTVGIGVAVTGVLARRPSLIALASAFAFAPAAVARTLWGKDPSVIHGVPLYRIGAALKAWRLTLVGGMQAEVERVAGAAPAAPEAPPEAEPIPRPNMVTDHTLH